MKRHPSLRRRAGSFPRGARASRGVALIEALIALTVLAVGVLGTLYFQGFVMSSATVSSQRLEAALLADELIAMAHSDTANAGCYANAGVTACGSAAAAAYMADWTARALARLPGAASHLPVVNFAADRTFTVTLQWVQKDGAVVRNHTMATQIGA